MANKLSDFLSIYTDKLNLDEEILNPIIEKANEIELPDELHGVLSNLMDLHGAKNNADVSKKFRMQYLTTVDKHNEKWMRENDFTDEMMSEFMTETDSLKKNAIVLNAVKSHYESTQTNDVDVSAIKKQYAEQINGLQATLAEKQNEWEGKYQSIENERRADKFDWKVDQLAGNYEFSDNLPKEDALYLIKTRLDKLPYTWKKNDANEYVAFQGENGDLEAIENGKQVTLKSIIETNALPYIKKSGTTEERTSTRIKTDPSGNSGKTFLGRPI